MFLIPFEFHILQFYSYTTCDPSIADWSSIPPKQTLGGITIMATCPTAYFPPYNYKRSPTGDILVVAGEGHYDNRWACFCNNSSITDYSTKCHHNMTFCLWHSVPYEGVLINYLKSLEEISNGDFSLSFTYGSKASELVHPKSAYTAGRLYRECSLFCFECFDLYSVWCACFC